MFAMLRVHSCRFVMCALYSLQLELLTQQIERSIATETAKNGLLIKKALYGNLNSDNAADDGDVINVTQQVQSMVKDSKLILPANTTLVSPVKSLF